MVIPSPALSKAPDVKITWDAPNQSITLGVASDTEKSSACEREFPQMEVQSARHDSFSWPLPC